MVSNKLLTLEQVAALIPGHEGKPLGRRTIVRWMNEGWQGIRLKSKCVGGLVRVAEVDLNAFIEECTAMKDRGSAPKQQRKRTPKQSADQRERLRRKHGIG